MVRTILILIIVFFATFFLPFWFQVVVYAFSVIFIKYRSLLLIPALFADAWYAPVRNLSPENNQTLLMVVGMIIIYFFIIRTTRIREYYGLENK